MNSRPNLTPSLTVDKNGKTTTVYRKNDSGAPSDRAMPAPALPTSFVSERPPRHLIIDEIHNTLQDGIHRTQAPLYKDKMTEIYRNLSGADDDAYPAMALEAVNEIIPKVANPAGVRAVIIVLANNDKDNLRTLHAHRSYLSENPSAVSPLLTLKKVLLESGIEADEDGRVATLENHLYAQDRFEEIVARDLSDDGSKRYYRNSPEVIQRVEKYPNHITELMEWMSRERTVNIDDEKFEEYLSEGVLRGGLL